MVRLVASLLITLGLVLSPLWVGAAELKIAIVDGSDILGKSSEVKKVQETLKRKNEELSRDLQKQDQELGKMAEDFRKQAGVMKEEAKKAKEADLNKRLAELQRKAQAAEKTIAQMEQKEMEPLFKKLEQAVTAVATESKLDIVLDQRRSGLLFRNPTLDITEKVRSRFGK